MVDQAGIKIPGEGCALMRALFDQRTILSLGATAMVGVVGFVFLIPLGRKGEPLVGDVIHSSVLKAVLFVAWIAILWSTGNWFKPR
jgi:hypothetical protein